MKNNINTVSNMRKEMYRLIKQGKREEAFELKQRLDNHLGIKPIKDPTYSQKRKGRNNK